MNTPKSITNRTVASVWSEMSGFQDSFVLCKNAAMSLATEGFLTTNESFQMIYYMKFYLKGIQGASDIPEVNLLGEISLLEPLTFCNSDGPWDKASYHALFESS